MKSNEDLENHWLKGDNDMEQEIERAIEQEEHLVDEDNWFEHTELGPIYEAVYDEVLGTYRIKTVTLMDVLKYRGNKTDIGQED